MGELISSMIDLISFSISSISEVSSRISLMVCFSSRDLAGIFEPIEVLAASRKADGGFFPYRPFEAFQKEICKSGKVCRSNLFVHMEIQKVKHRQMPYEVLEQVFPIQGKEYTQVWKQNDLSFARSFTLSKR